MKSLIVLEVGLLAVGCATVKDIGVHLGIGQSNTSEQKQKALRDSVVGEYRDAHSDENNTGKIVILANGVCELYVNGEKLFELNWSIVDGEIHAKYDSGEIYVFRINPDKSIMDIAYIEDGKRRDNPTKGIQQRWKKIK